MSVMATYLAGSTADSAELKAALSGPSVKARAVLSVTHNVGAIVGGVLGGVALLSAIFLLVLAFRRCQAERRAPLVSPLYRTPSYTGPMGSVAQTPPLLTPQRMYSCNNSSNRLSIHKPPFPDIPIVSNTHPAVPHLPARRTSLVAAELGLFAPYLPAPPPSIDLKALRASPSPSLSSINIIPAHRGHPNRATFQTGSSRSRITSYLPRYQRSYVPSYEDIPPAYQG